MQSYNWIGGVFLPESEFPIGGDYQICASSIVTILSIAIVITLMVSFTATLTSIPSYAAKRPGKGATITHGTCDILGTQGTGQAVETPSGRSNLQCHAG
jgi:hypothetical protein